VAAFDLYVDLAAAAVHSLLGSIDGRGGFYMGADQDIAAVADAAQDTACVVGGFYYMIPLHSEGIIILAAIAGGHGGSVADLHGLHGADGHGGLGQQGIQLAEDGITDPGGNP
jgi:hypothetical protein